MTGLRATQVNAAARRRVSGWLSRALLTLPAGAALAGCASAGKPPKLEPLASIPGSVSRLRWSQYVGKAGFGFAPAVADEKIIAAARNGRVDALDINTGRVLKTIQTKRHLASGVGSNGELHILADTNGQLFAVQADGKLRWAIDMGAESASLPVLDKNLVLIRQSNNAIAAYSLSDGSRRWLYTRRNPTLVLRQTSGIALDDTTAYVGLPGGRMVALALDSGASRWEAGISLPRGSNEIERIADVIATPVLGDASLCAAAFQGRVTCLDRSSGRALWTKNLSAGSGVSLGKNIIVSADVDGKILAFTRVGEPMWEHASLRGRRLSALLVVDDHIWVGDANGFVHTLNVADGKLVGRVATDGSQIVSTPLRVVAADQTFVVVQTTAGSVAAVSI